MKKFPLLFGCSLVMAVHLFAQTSIKPTFSALKTIALPNHIELEYAEQGNAKGMPVILLHGFTDSWYSFSRVLPYLPSDLHVFAVSMRGHGNSTRPDTGYQPRDFAGDVAAFMKAMRLGPAIIVGHSFGSLVAQQFAIDYPAQIRGLVLIGTFADVAANPVLKEMKTGMSALTDPIDPAFVEEFQKSTLTQAVPDTFIKTVVQESLKVPAHVWKSAMEGFLPVNNTLALRKFNKPTLILWGGKDVLCSRADQDALNHAIKGSQLFEYEYAGHGLHWEEPEKFAFDLIAFSRIVKNKM
jgi:pimeloyl-ACP methyl ester carboxylesterase